MTNNILVTGEAVIKCEKYWPGPGKTKTHGGIQIKCQSVTSKEEIEIDKLEIRKLKTFFQVRFNQLIKIFIH